MDLRSGWVALYRLNEVSQRRTTGVVPPNPLAEECHAYVF